ncbi:MAG: hypothetical protein WCL14_13085 [Bacteroidota bacterium]
MYFKLWITTFDEKPAVETSPDSSGSPLLCISNGNAAATADSGMQMGREETIGSLKELEIRN